MPYFSAAGLQHGELVTLAPPGTRTASGSGGAAVSAHRTDARLTLDVTAVSGTSPTMTVTVETAGDGVTWSAVGTFTAVTATGTQRKTFFGLDQYVRVSWTVGGTTPSFTFSVIGGIL